MLCKCKERADEGICQWDPLCHSCIWVMVICQENLMISGAWHNLVMDTLHHYCQLEISWCSNDFEGIEPIRTTTTQWFITFYFPLKLKTLLDDLIQFQARYGIFSDFYLF